MIKKLFLSVIMYLLMVGFAFAGVIINNPMFMAFDGNGDPLSGGLLYSYIEGTTTAKVLYTDKDCSTPASNPVVLDSRGESEIYGCSGSYKLVLKTSADVTIWTIDNIDISNVASSYLYFPDASQADQGAASASGNLTVKDFVDSIGTTKKATIVLVHTGVANTTSYTFQTSETITSNIDIELQNGALIVDDANNASLTINSEIIAGATQQIYDYENGTGTIIYSGGKLREMSPQHWGAFADGSTDDSDAINAALAQTCNKIVVFPPSDDEYIMESTPVVNSNTTIFGYGATIKIGDSASNGVRGFYLNGTIATPITNIHIKGITIDGNRSGRSAPAYTAGSHLILFKYVSNASIVDVIVKNGLADGLYIGSEDTQTARSSNIHIENVLSDNNYRQGFSVVGVIHMDVINSAFSNTNGQAPESGVDLEPDSTDANVNCWFRNIKVVDNSGIGFTQNADGNNNGIIGGEFSGNAVGIVATNGDNVENLTIKGVKIRDASTCIQIDAPYCIIEGNNISSSAGDRAIHLQDEAHHTTVTGNVIEDTDVRAIYVESDYNTISKNHIINPDGDGIYLYGTPQYNVITDNIVEINADFGGAAQDGYGIFVRGVGNKLSNNTLTSSQADSGPYGIQMSGTRHELYNNFVEGFSALSGRQIATFNYPVVYAASNNWDGTLGMYMGLPHCTLIKEVDLSTASTSRTVWTIPAGFEFMPDSVTARIDDDLAATNGDYWAIGVNGNNKRTDYGVCTTAAAGGIHSTNAKFTWLFSSNQTSQPAPAASTIEVISVADTTDAAALGNNFGGASGDQITVVIRGRLIEELPDL